MAAAFALSGCSLFKLSVSTGDPLPKDDVSARVMTRGFYYDMSNLAVATADSIAAGAESAEIRIRAIRWKIVFTRAAVTAAMQSIPEVALADTWILCRATSERWAALPDSALFGKNSDLARFAADSMYRRIVRIAADVLPDKRFYLMQQFVDMYMQNNPAGSNDPQAVNTTTAWIDFLRSKGLNYKYAGGTIPEVLADMNDKIGSQTSQLASSIGWAGEIVSLKWRQDSLRASLEARMDSLNGYADRTIAVLENIPGISDELLSALDIHLRSMMSTVDASLENALRQIDVQREYLQEFVSVQQRELARQADDIVQTGIRTAADAVPGIVNRIAAWCVLTVVVVFGLPFTAGFFIGRLSRSIRGGKNEK